MIDFMPVNRAVPETTKYTSTVNRKLRKANSHVVIKFWEISVFLAVDRQSME